VQGQAGNIVQTLNYRLDSYLVLLFVNAAGVGLYAVGVALSEGLWLAANSIAIVLIPKLASSDPEYAAKTTPLVCRNTMLATALAAGGLAAVSPLAVPFLFGNDFRDAVEPLLWLLPLLVIQPRKAWLYLTGVISVSYIFYVVSPSARVLIGGLEYLPFVLLLCWERWRPEIPALPAARLGLVREIP